MSRKQGIGDLWKGVESLDRAAVRRRVAQLRRDYPNASRDALHKRLVYSKCLQAGTVGAVTGVTSLVPIVGRFAGVLLGSVADATVVTTLQAELVAETFVLYDFELPEHAERMAVVAVAATNFGASAVSAEVARAVAKRAARYVGGTVAKRALPIASIATSAASNVGVTYLVGMRAQALCTMRDQPVDDWGDLLRGVTSIDERKLMDWAGNAASTAIEAVGSTASSMLSRLNDLVRMPARGGNGGGGRKSGETRKTSSGRKRAGGGATKTGGTQRGAGSTAAKRSTSASSTAGKRAGARKSSSASNTRSTAKPRTSPSRKKRSDDA